MTFRSAEALYSDGTTPVLPGDFVEMRVWASLFRKKVGRVIYVPGISKLHKDMEFNGLTWVGIRFDDGMVVGSLVDPKTHRLKKGVRFLKRGEVEIDELEPETALEG